MFLPVPCPLPCHCTLHPDIILGNCSCPMRSLCCPWSHDFKLAHNLISSLCARIIDAGVGLWPNRDQLEFSPDKKQKRHFLKFTKMKSWVSALLSGRILAGSWWWPSWAPHGVKLLKNETKREGSRTYRWSHVIGPQEPACLKPLTGMTWHLYHPSLVIVLSPETKSPVWKREFETNWTPRKMARLSWKGYGWLKELALNPSSANFYLDETSTVTQCFLHFFLLNREPGKLFISLSSDDYIHVKSSLKVQIKCRVIHYSSFI